MRVERITDKQGICLITIFIIGSSILIGTGGEAGNDAWLAGLTGLFMSLPAILVYARISSLFPEKSLRDTPDCFRRFCKRSAEAALYKAE